MCTVEKALAPLFDLVSYDFLMIEEAVQLIITLTLVIILETFKKGTFVYRC